MLLLRCLVDQRRFQDAEPVLTRAYASIEREFGPAHARTQTAIERAIELYVAWNRPAQVSAWRSKLKRP
jgi:hypothetical protein